MEEIIWAENYLHIWTTGRDRKYRNSKLLDGIGNLDCVILLKDKRVFRYYKSVKILLRLRRNRNEC